MKNSTHISKNASTKRSSSVFLKKQFENFGSEEILDANGLSIGKIKIPFLHLNKKLEIKDLFKDKVIVLEKENKIFSKTCVIKEKNGQLIASVKKKRFSLYPSKILLKNNLKVNQYIGIGDFKQYNYKIIDSARKLCIVQVKNVSEKANLPKSIESDSNNYYCLNFVEFNTKKFIVIAFTICINILFKTSLGLSDLAGFERRIARLRPFGFGKNLN